MVICAEEAESPVPAKPVAEMTTEELVVRMRDVRASIAVGEERSRGAKVRLGEMERR